MNVPVRSSSAPEEELRCFVVNLKHVFHGEAWSTVAPYAARAWEAVGLAEDLPWDEAEPRIRADWS